MMQLDHEPNYDPGIPLGVLQGDPVSPSLRAASSGTIRVIEESSPTPEPLEFSLVRSSRRVRQRREGDRMLIFPFFGPAHSVTCEHCTIIERQAIKANNLPYRNGPTGLACCCVFLGMNGMPLYNGEPVLAPREISNSCRSLFHRRCVFQTHIARGSIDPVRVRCTNATCDKYLPVSSASLLSMAFARSAFGQLQKTIRLRLRQVYSMRIKLQAVGPGVLLDEFFLHWNTVDCILRLRCVCSTFKNGVKKEALPFALGQGRRDRYPLAQAQQLFILLKRLPGIYIGLLTGAKQLNNSGSVISLCGCIAMQNEEFTFSVAPLDVTVPMPWPYRNMQCLLVSGGMKRTPWLPELSPKALMTLDFPPLPSQCHSIVFFADRQGTPQKILEEAIHELPFCGFMASLTDRTANLLALVQSRVFRTLLKVERLVMESSARDFYMFLSNQSIDNYIQTFGTEATEGTHVVVSLMEGANLQPPTEVSIYDFLSFEQIRRHRDELAILRVEVYAPTKGVYRRVLDRFAECAQVPNGDQDIMISPIRMVNHSSVQHTILPSKGILQTFLEMAIAHAFPHSSIEEPLFFRRQTMGVLLKLEFLRQSSINSTRRGIGGDLPWQILV